MVTTKIIRRECLNHRQVEEKQNYKNNLSERRHVGNKVEQGTIVDVNPTIKIITLNIN